LLERKIPSQTLSRSVQGALVISAAARLAGIWG
jgi:hypothetical protein